MRFTQKLNPALQWIRYEQRIVKWSKRLVLPDSEMLSYEMTYSTPVSTGLINLTNAEDRENRRRYRGRVKQQAQ